MRPGSVLLFSLVVALVGAGCPVSNQGSGVGHAAGVIGALGSAANLSADLLSTFQADVRSEWAVAYDPAAPPGCVAGGLRTAAGAAPPVRPCRAYLLERVNLTWTLRAVGMPGAIEVPRNAPSDLGDPARLGYLGR